MTTIKLKKAIFEDEIWKKIKEALDEHKKGETIKVTPQTLWDVSKRLTKQKDNQLKEFYNNWGCTFQPDSLLEYNNAEKIPYISYIFYTFAYYRRVNN